MTGKEINSCKKCIVCTGCGRGAGKTENLQAISTGNVEKNCYLSLPDVDENALLIATDIGTTTIVMQLRRMQSGEVLDTFRVVNPQRKYGMDVLSRIQAAEENKASVLPGAVVLNAAEEMKGMVLEVLKQGTMQFEKYLQTYQNAESGCDGPGNIEGMVIAANTTMIHLLMGYPVDSLGKAPFMSEYLEEIHTEVAGIKTVIMPGISTFVGADILAGIYACIGNQITAEGEEASGTFLLLDLGTNGEMVLGSGDGFLATATAAGPAFEGRLDANVWGADAICFLAKLYKKGLVDETGLLADEYFESGVSVGSTIMTQADIRSLQLAKAAVHAGIRVLCEEFIKMETSDIDRVYLAGGFGYFLNSKDAVAIGLLPKELAKKCVPVGNAALEGAFCYGRERFSKNREISECAHEKLTVIKQKTQSYNLAYAPDFEKYYIESMNLPC